MTATESKPIDQFKQAIRDCFIPRPSGRASDWAHEHLVIPSGPRPGPFSFAASEYMVEPVDCFSDSIVSDVVMCFGAQSGKTTVLMAGVSWVIANEKSGIVWVMPSIDLARSFSATRWQPLLQHSPVMDAFIPRGRERFDFSKSQQILNGSHLNFVGSNSPGNLSSRPARVILMDETDKFPVGSATGDQAEADPVFLAEQRSKRYGNPKRIKASTPTLTDGVIWQRFLEGDQRRYETPCPACGTFSIWGWNPDFTALPKTGRESWVAWDKEAQRTDKTWDLDRVFSSARVECFHCHAHIREEHKTRCLREGRWVATAKAPASFRSYHLPSFYAAGTQTSFGALAVSFLRGKQSLDGLRGFINGELAEPWENQDSRSARVELVSPRDAEPLPESVVLLTVDVQATSPYHWVIARAWTTDGQSRLIGAWSCDDWDAVRRIQLAVGAMDNHVTVDSSDRTDDVRETCLRYGKEIPVPGKLPLWVGWTPWQGQKKDWRSVNETKGTAHPFGLTKLGVPLSGNRRVRLMALQFAGDFFLGTLSRLRAPKEGTFAPPWAVTDFPAGPEVPGAARVEEHEYWRHLDSKQYVPVPVGRLGRISWEWKKRGQRWPDHLLDCEAAQLAWATFHRRFPIKLVATADAHG